MAAGVDPRSIAIILAQAVREAPEAAPDPGESRRLLAGRSDELLDGRDQAVETPHGVLFELQQCAIDDFFPLRRQP